ncbi:hypothetical protein MMC18_002232 [Xylographa bjoerkii]|nr:hypothetical protein [Xylographa bjoerkii]
MISEVGYLHENQAIEAILMLKGVHPIKEDEFLQIVKIALAPDAPDNSDHFADGHILIGLEILGLQRIRAMGRERPTAVLGDPRAAIIAGAYAAAAEEPADQQSNGGSGGSTLPAAVSAALAASTRKKGARRGSGAGHAGCCGGESGRPAPRATDGACIREAAARFWHGFDAAGGIPWRGVPRVQGRCAVRDLTEQAD